MEEKIKITLPCSVINILMRDAEDFLFLKKDTKINQNLFINTLIVSYFETFSNIDEDFHDQVNYLFKEFSLSSSMSNDLYNNLLKVLVKKDSSHYNEETKTISFKPTKMSIKVISYINDVAIKNESIASYYRRLFISYASHPKNERETIIFKDVYNKILHSIN